ncbi:hypothetical protein EVA_16720 [gut metagenome]|uniref:Uncharacterized protein n=1 Tax=gut metagenome TaxID=749906 RepID=J9G064_9ZZZZ
MVSKYCVASSGGNHVIKHTNCLALNVRFIKIDNADLSYFFFRFTMFMDAETFTRYTNERIAIGNSGQFADTLTKALVATFMLCLTACRNTNKYHVLQLLTIFFHQILGYLLRHFFLSTITRILECPNKFAGHHCVQSHVFDSLRKILTEPSLRFFQLLFELFIDCLCHSLSLFLPSVGQPFQLAQGIFFARKEWRRQ